MARGEKRERTPSSLTYAVVNGQVCRWCRSCREHLPVTSFYPSSIKRNIYECAKCVSSRMKVRRHLGARLGARLGLRAHTPPSPLQEYYANSDAPVDNRITPKEARDAIAFWGGSCFVTGLSDVPIAFVRVKAAGSPAPGARVVPCFRPVAKAFEHSLPSEYNDKWLQEVLKRLAVQQPIGTEADPSLSRMQARLDEFKRQRTDSGGS